jgi:Fic family protein
MITTEELDFLRESNNIEEEWDDKSLQDAILAWEHVRSKQKLTRKLILEVHALLMRSRDTLENTQKGVFRDGPVWVGLREGKPWYVVPELIENWLSSVNADAHLNGMLRQVGSEDKAKELHVQYEHIHPFFDGNGRTGRIFYNWHRMRIGLPVQIIHYGKEQQEYYTWFD